MALGLPDAFATLRQPEYTGENRCTPCTIVNAVIAVAGAIAVTVFAPVGSTAAVGLGLVVLGVSAGLIALRGYLVPGTPWLTRTYLPDRVLRYFEHGPSTRPDADIDPGAVLDAADALTECDDVDDLCLTEEFRDDWYARMDELRGEDATRSALAAILGLDAAEIELQDFGGAVVALADKEALPGRRRVGQWESNGALIADMAGAHVVADRNPEWAELSTEARGRVLSGLRVFLDTCPTCGGPVRFGEETVQSCCRSREVVAVTCESCDDRLFEADQPAAA